MARLHRRSVIRGLAGVSLALPALEAMGREVAEQIPRRFCAMYTANGMSLPSEDNKIPEWSWFPRTEGSDFEFGQSTLPLAPFRSHLSFLGGLHHSAGVLADPHMCSDMWLTGAPLHNPKPGTFNTAGLDQVVALHTRQYCRQPSLVLSIDAGVGFLSRTGTISWNLQGKPLPAENNPRRVFDRLFRGDTGSADSQRAKLAGRIRLVDAVLDGTRQLNARLGAADRRRMDQYLTSLDEIESRLTASERWLNVPLKPQDHSHLNLDITNEDAPADYYRNMFDLIALAFDADITRSVTFMLNREDGMGISDTFPLKLGLTRSASQLVARHGSRRAAGIRKVRPIPQPADCRIPVTFAVLSRRFRNGPGQYDRALRQRLQYHPQPHQSANAHCWRQQSGTKTRQVLARSRCSYEQSLSEHPARSENSG
ncbi:MAG UNVERIFIED_CONTAM: DUF1552 domain-containing protein [Planctomycetaceae bacterium]|jgi:hypothetical protein